MIIVITNKSKDNFKSRVHLLRLRNLVTTLTLFVFPVSGEIDQLEFFYHFVKWEKANLAGPFVLSLRALAKV
jgi:hypothetical protein